MKVDILVLHLLLPLHKDHKTKNILHLPQLSKKDQMEKDKGIAPGFGFSIRMCLPK